MAQSKLSTSLVPPEASDCMLTCDIDMGAHVATLLGWRLRAERVRRISMIPGTERGVY